MISHAKYFAFCEDYARGTFPHQRFGQAFINTFWVQLNIMADPEIFYMESYRNAARLIENKYVDWNG